MYVEIEGLAFLPLYFMGFIDCSIDAIWHPLRAPAGSYKSAGKKEFHDIVQRHSIWDTNTTCIKIETVFLPNGMSTLFHAVSVCQNDVDVYCK